MKDITNLSTSESVDTTPTFKREEEIPFVEKMKIKLAKLPSCDQKNIDDAQCVSDYCEDILRNLLKKENSLLALY
jgi:hypothetical protein